jgi:2-phospho-L-lactate guanylyltransferase
MRTAAVLPVKRFPLAKQRLGESVEDSLRAALARAMVGDVLSALRDCPAIEATIVVTREPSVAAAARYVGAVVVEDTLERGQSAAASLGLARAAEDGFERALCVPGDCPTLDTDELVELLSRVGGGESDAGPQTMDDVHRQNGAPHATRGGARPRVMRAGAYARVPRARVAWGEPKSEVATAEVVIVPDRHGSGTNGLLLTPPDAVAPSFGPDSRARHEQLARDAGVAWRIAETPSLLLDIDTGEDLAMLRERLAGERVRAPRTRAVLARNPGGDRAGDRTPASRGHDFRAA